MLSKIGLRNAAIPAARMSVRPLPYVRFGLFFCRMQFVDDVALGGIGRRGTIFGGA